MTEPASPSPDHPCDCPGCTAARALSAARNGPPTPTEVAALQTLTPEQGTVIWVTRDNYPGRISILITESAVITDDAKKYAALLAGILAMAEQAIGMAADRLGVPRMAFAQQVTEAAAEISRGVAAGRGTPTAFMLPVPAPRKPPAGI